MKKIKFLLFFLVLAMAGVVVYQNWPYFSAKTLFGIDLKFNAYKSPEIANGLLLLGFFTTGFIISYINSLLYKFRTSKIVRELNSTIDSQQEKLSSFRGEIENLKNEIEDEKAP